MTGASLPEIESTFFNWRKSRGHRGRIPERLWELAVSAAAAHSVSMVAKAASLDYYQLKARVGKVPAQLQAQRGKLPAQAPGTAPVTITCSKIIPVANAAWQGDEPSGIAEFEDSSGLKLRIPLTSPLAQRVLSDFFAGLPRSREA